MIRKFQIFVIIFQEKFDFRVAIMDSDQQASTSSVFLSRVTLYCSGVRRFSHSVSVNVRGSSDSTSVE